MWLLIPSLLIVQLLRGFHSLPNGAPPSVCQNLLPVHRQFQPQNGRSSYVVKAEKVGSNVKVTISSTTGEEFQGLVLQARLSGNRDQIVNGIFSTTNNVTKTLDCDGGSRNTLTHANKGQKSHVETYWTPDAGVSETVIFRATVAKTFREFWTGIESDPVQVSGSDDGGDITGRRKDDDDESEDFYDGCFRSKGCFAYPADCVSKRDCQVLLSYADAKDGIEFALYGYNLQSNEYISMGLSKDKFMGEDSVTSCYKDNNKLVARNSWNNGKSNVPLELVESYRAKVENGITSCKWKKPYATRADNLNFNLEHENYYILLASGKMSEDDPGKIGYHSNFRNPSSEEVNFTAYEFIGSEGTDPAVKVHGAFMVTAWIGFVSLGILLARHFKPVWESHEMCGVKIWFAFHRGLMLAALGLVIIAFVLIFVHKKGWNYATKNPHAVLGCITTALGLFQPLMALFRPAPDHPKRPVFNWLHWGVGNAAHILAVVTIFFATSLQSSGLKDSFYWVLATYVVIHCFFHFVFQLHAWTIERRNGKQFYVRKSRHSYLSCDSDKNNEIKMVEMSGGKSVNQPGENIIRRLIDNKIRLCLLAFYGAFLSVILLVLYILIGTA